MRSMITLLIFAINVAAAHAQIFVNNDAAGNDDGSTWEHAYTDLQIALENANSGDQLWIAAGTYKPDGPTPDSSHFIVDKAVELYGGFVGTESMLEDRNWSSNSTILSGDINSDDTPDDTLGQRTDNAFHVVIIHDSVGIPVIDGLILEGGTTRLDDFPPDVTDFDPWKGGAMLIKSNATLRNCNFRDNNGRLGAALHVSNRGSSKSEFALRNCVFESNKSVNGGVQFRGLEDPIVTNCTFKNNRATRWAAGLELGNTNATLRDCTFEMNESGILGGAIFMWQNSSTGIIHPSVNISNSLFKDNVTVESGGAIAFNNFIQSSQLNLDSCVFTRNTVTDISFGDGGAIRVYSSPSPFGKNPTNVFIGIHETEIIENTAIFGGGLFCLSADDTLEIDISDSRFTNNTGNSDGGGAYLYNLQAGNLSVDLQRNVFIGNIANFGGGALLFDNTYSFNRIKYTVDSCLFQSNSAQIGGAIWSTIFYGAAGAIGSILNSEFIENRAWEMAGAILFEVGQLSIENSLFSANISEGTSSSGLGGGATAFANSRDIIVKNSIYANNESNSEASAALLLDGSTTRFENVLFSGNSGNSTVLSLDSLHMLNVTMVNNTQGIFQLQDKYTEFQNTILNNDGSNYIGEGKQIIVSKGGNIISDLSLSSQLTGYGEYDDLHGVDPLLDETHVPMKGSPCVDAGNPDGVSADYDLAGEDRIQGNGIDIGSYESAFTVAVRDVVWNTPELTVFPNPVKQTLQFRIEDDWAGDLHVSIYNLLGQKVFASKQSKTHGQKIFQRKIGHLATGVYVLLVSSGEETYASQIVIQ